MNQPNKVKTRVSVDEAFKNQDSRLYPNAFAAGWNAALDSVILPESKRFEVGDEVRIRVNVHTTAIGQIVEGIPQTRDLTEQEKVDALLSCPRVTHVQLVIAVANGKTLDQLCQECGVATTREVP
jgi:hypothetical protein